MSFDSVLSHVASLRASRAAASASVGAIERRNPIPPGRYWVDVFAKDEAAFAAWRRAHPDSIRVVSTEHFDSDPPRDWVLFDVVTPTNWEGPGLPTIATSAVQSSSDTVDRPPPPPSFVDQVEQTLDATGKTLRVAIGVAAAVALTFLVVAKGRS